MARDLALLDEPFVGLDRDLRDILARYFSGKIEQQGMARILVTHDRFETARLSRDYAAFTKGMDVQNVITLPTPLSNAIRPLEGTVVARNSKESIIMNNFFTIRCDPFCWCSHSLRLLVPWAFHQPRWSHPLHRKNLLEFNAANTVALTASMLEWTNYKVI